MGRAQESAISNTESANSATETAAATNSQEAEQADIGTQQSQLAKFAAANPYVQGGQAQTVGNQQLSNTADATAAAAKAQNQQQAQRTGQNATAGVAAGEAEAQAAQRALGASESAATTSRLAANAQYGQDVLSGTNQITSQQNALGSQETGQALSEEQIAENAAKTPSYGDMAGTMILGGSTGTGTCHVSAELYGGWDDPRTITLRAWLFGPCREKWAGRRFTDLYYAYGERWAAAIHGNHLLRFVTQLVFDRLLDAAQKNKGMK
jgi:hypothetical protein